MRTLHIGITKDEREGVEALGISILDDGAGLYACFPIHERLLPILLEHNIVYECAEGKQSSPHDLHLDPFKAFSITDLKTLCFALVTDQTPWEPGQATQELGRLFADGQAGQADLEAAERNEQDRFKPGDPGHPKNFMGM